MRELTRNQIMRALECCEGHGNCQECPLSGKGIKGCMFNAMHEALELIKELIAETEFYGKQAIYYLGQYEKKSEEYERLIESECDHCSCALLDQRDRAREEVIRKMQDRLKEEAGYFGRAVAVEVIDQVAKEMLEDNT